MLPLRDLQLRFVSALFDDAAEATASWLDDCESDVVSDAVIGAEARLSIYRNNLREGFRKALSLEFPVIERLVGEDYFSQLALEFLGAHPSLAGDLQHIGQPFPRFLELRFDETPYTYLPDVARLEWAYQQSLIAADAPRLDPATLRGVPQEAHGELRFTLHPTCGLVRSDYPILRIWTANQPEANGDESIDLDSGADFVVLYRTAQNVSLQRVTAADFAILHAFRQGATLAQALETASAVDSEFDLGEALRRFVCLGVIAGTQAAHPRRPGEPLS